MVSVYWLACATGTPPNVFTQEELFELAGYQNFPAEQRRLIGAIFRASGVKRRAMWFPRGGHQQRGEGPDGFHTRYVTGIREMVPRVARQALMAAGLEPEQIGLLVFASCTGYTCPGFSIELARSLGLPETIPTANLLGMGCSALVPAMDRATDRLLAHPGQRALVIAAEICSATYWIDEDLETAVGNSIFADGAAAVVLTSNERDLNGPRGLNAGDAFSHFARIEGYRTLRDGRFLDDMGFTNCKGRLRVRLSREVPERVLPLVLKMTDLLELPESSRVAFHPGGKKILDGLEAALRAKSESWSQPIRWSREVLRDHGNMSSPTAAFVLQRSIRERELRRGGERGALITMGPGLSVEGVKLSWLG